MSNDPIERLTAERDAAIAVAERWRGLCDTATTALLTADAEVTRLRALVVEGATWWCLRGKCETLNTGAAEVCRRCQQAKPRPDGRHA